MPALLAGQQVTGADCTEALVKKKKKKNKKERINSEKPVISVTQDQVFTIKSSKVSTVVDGVCNDCKTACEVDDMICCFICKFVLHKPCYREGVAVGWKEKSRKWFCKDCRKISIEELLQLAIENLHVQFFHLQNQV